MRSCLAATRETKAVKAFAHITGGGFVENIPRVLPKDAAVDLDLDRVPVLPVFKWLATAGAISEPEMLRTFNCGIGMVVVVAPEMAEDVSAALRAAGEEPVRIGEIVAIPSGPRVLTNGRLAL